MPDLSVLFAEVRAAGLVDTLSGARLFTVFAPPGEAFGKLAAGTLDKLLIPRSKTELVKVLTYHAVDGSVQTGESKDAER